MQLTTATTRDPAMFRRLGLGSSDGAPSSAEVSAPSNTRRRRWPQEKSTQSFYCPSPHCFFEESAHFHGTHCNMCHPVVVHAHMPRCSWWSCWRGSTCRAFSLCTSSSPRTQLARRYSLAGAAKAVVVLALSGCRGFVWDSASPPKCTPSEQQDTGGRKWWSRSSNVETNNV